MDPEEEKFYNDEEEGDGLGELYSSFQYDALTSRGSSTFYDYTANNDDNESIYSYPSTVRTGSSESINTLIAQDIDDFLTREDEEWPESTISETPSRPLPTPLPNKAATLPYKKKNYAASIRSVDSVAPFATTSDSMQLAEFCKLIDDCVSLERAKIVSVECYRVRYGVVLHRFLVFHLQRRKGRSEVWLRVDRMSGKGVVIGGGSSPANDVARLGLSQTEVLREKGRNVKPTLDNRLEFKASQQPTLGAFRFFFTIICEELKRYEVWPANCWFFCSLLQEHLRKAVDGGAYVQGKDVGPNIAPDIRQKIELRVYHVVTPPPSIATVLTNIQTQGGIKETFAGSLKSTLVLAKQLEARIAKESQASSSSPPSSKFSKINFTSRFSKSSSTISSSASSSASSSSTSLPVDPSATAASISSISDEIAQLMRNLAESLHTLSYLITDHNHAKELGSRAIALHRKLYIHSRISGSGNERGRRLASLLRDHQKRLQNMHRRHMDSRNKVDHERVSAYAQDAVFAAAELLEVARLTYEHQREASRKAWIYKLENLYSPQQPSVQEFGDAERQQFAEALEIYSTALATAEQFSPAARFGKQAFDLRVEMYRDSVIRHSGEQADSPKHPLQLAYERMKQALVHYVDCLDRNAEMDRSEEACSATMVLVEINRQQKTRDENTIKRSLDALALLLVHLRNFGSSGLKRALEVSEEMLTLRRDAYNRVRGGPAEYLPRMTLQKHLSGYVDELRDAGRIDDAISKHDELVELRRLAYEVNRPVDFLEFVASLRRHAFLLREARRPKEALAPTREIVEMYQSLYDPNQANYVPELIKASEELASSYTSLHDYKNASIAHHSIVDLYQARVRITSPDDSLAFLEARSSLISAQLAYAESLRADGQLEEALEPAHDAVEGSRAIVKTSKPSSEEQGAFDQASSPLLLRALSLYGTCLVAPLGRIKDACAIYQEIVQLRRDRAFGPPESEFGGIGMESFAKRRVRIEEYDAAVQQYASLLRSSGLIMDATRVGVELRRDRLSLSSQSSDAALLADSLLDYAKRLSSLDQDDEVSSAVDEVVKLCDDCGVKSDDLTASIDITLFWIKHLDSCIRLLCDIRHYDDAAALTSRTLDRMSKDPRLDGPHKNLLQDGLIDLDKKLTQVLAKIKSTSRAQLAIKFGLSRRRKDLDKSTLDGYLWPGTSGILRTISSLAYFLRMLASSLFSTPLHAWMSLMKRLRFVL